MAVLLEPAAFRIEFLLPATPPHGAAPLRPVRTTRPVEVVRLTVLFLAVDTILLIGVVVSSLTQFRDFRVTLV
jgi:hypothetical protein